MNDSANETRTCEECGAETKAHNTMGRHGGTLCGTCKRAEQARLRRDRATDRAECPTCGPESDIEVADDGLWLCLDCNTTFKGRTQ